MMRLAFAVLFVTMSIGASGAHNSSDALVFIAALVKDRNVQLVVRLEPKAAKEFLDAAGAGSAPALAELKSVLRRFGADLKPQHPNIADLELASYFTISNLNQPQADELAAALRKLTVVDAAYVQPTAVPPVESRGQE